MEGRLVSERLVEREVFGSESVDEVSKGCEGLGVRKVTADGFDLVSLSSGAMKTLGDGGERVFPAGGDEAAVRFNERGGQSLKPKSIV